MRFFPSSLRSRVLVLGGVALVLSVVLIQWEIRSEYHEAVASAETDVEVRASLVASQIETVMDDVAEMARRLADRPLVRDLDPASCQPWMGEARALFPSVARLLLADAEGEIVCAADALPGQPAPVGGRSWFQEALRTGALAVGSPEVGADGRWTVPVALLLEEEGEPLAVVSVSLRVERVQGLLDALPPAGGQVVTVVDSSWIAVARTAETERWVGGSFSGMGLVDPRSAGPGAFRSPGVDGVERIWAFAEPEGTPWFVLAGVPADEVVAAAWGRVVSHTLVAAVAIALFLAALLLLSRQVGQSLRRLGRAASEAQAARGLRLPEDGLREVREVSRTLNEMLSARDRAETELAQTAERHELVLRASRDMIWDWDLTTGRVERNEALRAFTGEDPVVLAHAGMEVWYDRIPEPDRTRVRRSLETALSSGDAVWVQEYPVRRADGTRVRVMDRGYVVRNSAGEAVRVVGAMTDVTDERRRSDEVRRAKERYESILRNAPFGVFLAGPDGHVMEWNPALETILGETWDGSIPARRAPEFFVDPAEFDALAREAREEGIIIGREAVWRRADGEEIYMRLTASAFLERGRIALEVLAEDVTERRRLGEQARQSQKMEAVGRLAGGVAHDFNNLLTVISGEARLLLSAGTDDEELTESLEAIQEAGDRGSRLTRQLLAFSRRQSVERRSLDLNEVIDDLRRMLVRVLGEKVRLSATLSDDLPPVLADSGELEQVLVNLAVNARDAMPEDGHLEIGTEAFTLAPGQPGRHAGLEPGHWVVLMVRDDGIGMDERTMSRIFEPFYSTKTVGKGTGLGLSTVYGIITRSGGQIDVESEPGRGTTFRIYLPALDEAEADSATAQADGTSGASTPVVSPVERRAAEPARAEGVLALVEDEDPVRRMAVRVLERAGYQVHAFGDPLQAVEALGLDGPTVDLLISDIRMPGLDGDQMADRIRSVRPDLPVLFVSGYPEEVQLQDRLRDGTTHFLAKPFRPDELLEHVRRLRMMAAGRSRG